MYEGGIPEDVINRCLARRGRLHTFESIDPARTGMLVVDMQNAFVAEGAAAEIPTAREVVPNINRINAALRRAGGLVVWIVSTYGPNEEDRWPIMYDHVFGEEQGKSFRAALTAGSPGHSVYAPLEQDPTARTKRTVDVTVSKNRFSAFVGSGGGLEQLLRDRGIDTVLVTGTVTSVCCESTAREAAMRNFKTVMITDGNAGRDDEEHWASLSNILLGFGDIYSTEEVIALFEA